MRAKYKKGNRGKSEKYVLVWVNVKEIFSDGYINGNDWEFFKGTKKYNRRRTK